MHGTTLTAEPGVGGRTARAGRWPQALLLLLASCLPVLGAVLVAPLLPAIATDFAGTPGVDVLVPLVIAAPALLIAIVSPLAGAIADRYGRKRVLLLGFPLYAVLGLAPLFLTSLPLIVASRFALGAAEALIMTICTTLIGDYFDGERRARMLSLQTIATSVAAVAFVLIGGALGTSGWRTPFWIYGSALLFLPAAAALLWEPIREKSPGDAAHVPPMPWRALAPVYALTLIGAIGFYVVPAQAAFLLQAAGITAVDVAGMVNGAGQFSILIGAASFNLLVRWGTVRTIAAGFVLSGAGLVLLARADTLGTIIGGAVVNGLGVGLLLPAFLTATLKLVTLPQRGRGAGGFTTAFFLGQFVSPLLILALGAALGGLGSALLALAVMTLAAAPLALAGIRADQAA